MQVSSQAQALMQDMIKKPLFVALRKPADLTRFHELLPAHLQWAVQCEQRGELFASGPFIDANRQAGAPGGMSIFRAGSIDEVERILSGDPFISQGVYTAEIKKWMLMEGGMSVTVSFSKQTYQLR